MYRSKKNTYNGYDKYDDQRHNHGGGSGGGGGAGFAPGITRK